MSDRPARADRQGWSIITANVGGYDEVHPVAPDAGAADWVYVTDTTETARRAEALGWRAVVLPQTDEVNFLRSRRPKVAPHRFTDRSASVYVDGRFAIETEEVIDDLAVHLAGDDWLALFRHDRRSSVFEEADECLRLGLGGPLVRAQMRTYRAAGVPHATGLWCGGVIVRRHCSAQERFGEAWFRELEEWPTRDQLSLPVVLAGLGVLPATVIGSVYAFRGVRVTPHRVARAMADRPPPLGRRARRRLAQLRATWRSVDDRKGA